jgi:transcriptional regulator with XRE-family HTH domain
MSLRTNPDFQLKIAHRLREARESLGFSQEKVAEKLHKTQSYVSRCETGNRRLDIVELEEFSRLYNKPLSFFIDG